ncbi:MAG: cation:proton antiporter [Spirochaetia bacterium]|nr:cation:proton antiporter [Spirochaetia bacterium]
MTHKMLILVLQLGLIILATRLSGWFFSRKLKQSQVLGELAAGMLIGPYLLGAVHIPALEGPLFAITEGTIPVSPELYGLATVGSVILLFVSGLETDLKTFIKFSGKGSAVGIGGIVFSFLLGSGVTVLFNPAVDSIMHPTALFLGTISTATSVGITARILSEKKKLSTPEGVTILAAAVLDDVFSIVLLSIVIGMTAVAAAGGSIQWGPIGVVAVKAIGFWLVCTVIGIIAAPHIIKGLKYFESLELIVGASFGIALVLAGLSEMVGLAMIIGAYITGLSFSQTDAAHEIREQIQGLYDFLVPIFFCVMGMMVNFAAMADVIWFGLAFTVVGLIGKLFGCGIPAYLAGFNLRGSVRIGVGMIPRGEVALIIAGIGLSAGVIGTDMFGVAIMNMLIASVAAPPLLIKSFEGGSGYRKALGEKEEAISIELEFPTELTSSFLRRSLIDGFRREEFFVNRLDHSAQVYQIRKERMIFTLMQQKTRIIVNTPPEHEQLIRLMMIEELLTFKEFLSGLETMKSPDMMGAELIMGMFARAEAHDR